MFFLVSDEMPWVLNNIVPILGNDKYNPISQPEIRDYEEIILMSNLDHFIIANSSFSWWGAWLGEKNAENNKKNPIVIAPYKWNSTTSFPYGPVPERWIRVKI